MSAFIYENNFINSELNQQIASLSPMHKIVNRDAGLHIPQRVSRTDLASKPGTPSIIERVDTVISELGIAQVIIEANQRGGSAPSDLQNCTILVANIHVFSISHQHTKDIML